ncbi:hypothetical protein N8972_00300 [Sulfurospirillum sp.]|nr:hypothetical protein [Sulfurospirillum sp.]
MIKHRGDSMLQVETKILYYFTSKWRRLVLAGVGKLVVIKQKL